MTLEQKDLYQILEVAIDAARLAGQHALKQMYSAKTSIKNSEDFVTEADTECQQIIIDRIRQTFLEHGFIAEEGDNGRLFKQPPLGKHPIWWVIDPIDGTNNFAHKMPLFAVSIGVMYDGEPVAGVIFDPTTGYIFTAVKGGIAQRNSEKITASSDKMDKFASIGLDSHLDGPLPAWTEELMRRTRFRTLGSAALQIAYVANGGLIATLFSHTRLWDIAAGVIIAELADAIVTDWNGKPIFPLNLDNYDGQEIKILVANKTTHAEILQLLKRQ
jgi:myo-inositol-1(or 4)-monophosphatase